jgi:hypothetical protein
VDRLTPTANRLYVVRWIRADGRDIKHRYFAREIDARAFHAKLTGFGKTAAIFTTVTSWTPPNPPHHPNGSAHT